MTLRRLHRLDNRNCPYCGVDFVRGSFNLDHVIGRKFTPKNQLAGQWNIGLNACIECNTEKSSLESEFSAISLQSIHSPGNPRDPLIVTEASRKGTARSSQTGQAVRDSFANFKIEGPLMGVLKMSFGVVAPPQLDEQRALMLAFQQVTGFFFFISYNSATNRGGFCPGIFNGFQIIRKGDWGNPCAVAFARQTCDWSKCIVGVTANGFYKIAIRRKPDAECWSWAVEWNKSIRLFGAFGDETAIMDLSNQLPSLEFQQLDSLNRIRQEVPLNADDDLMFLD